MLKKILFVIPNLEIGGTERVIFNIIQNINKKKYRLVLILLQKKGPYVLHTEDDLKIIDLNIKRIRHSLIKLLRIIKKEAPFAVFLTLDFLPFLAPFLWMFPKRIKFIARQSNIASLCYQNNTKGLIMKALCRLFYNNYNYIIAQSNDMKQDLIDNYKIKAEKIIIINNPIDTNFINKELQKEINVEFPKNKFNLVACGRLTLQKGFDNLIKAFSTLRNKDKYHLTILGKGTFRDPENQEELLNNLVVERNLEKNVTFAGFQTNVYKWLEQADVFILSSRYEGFPNVVLEALYCGTPVLANNCPGGINEIIQEKKNGFIFEIGKDDFEKKLETISSVDFEKIKIKETVNRFYMENIIKQYEQIL